MAASVSQGREARRAQLPHTPGLQARHTARIPYLWSVWGRDSHHGGAADEFFGTMSAPESWCAGGDPRRRRPVSPANERS